MILFKIGEIHFEYIYKKQKKVEKFFGIFSMKKKAKKYGSNDQKIGQWSHKNAKIP